MGLFNSIADKIDNLFNANNYGALTYASILKDRQNFRRAGTRSGGEFNLFDTPGKKYFKILFYFGQSDSFDSGGLLTPTWNALAGEKPYDYSITDNTKFYEYNSAWAYLMLNDEKDRAEQLEQFVNLLSNINSNSPWYFTAIGGIQEAMERKVASDGKFELPENRKLTITCLPDAFDNRLTTLLELYRDITWSWTMKREVLPANLRKFDMAIYIFETPINYWHEKDDTVRVNLGSSYTPSCKMLEFHNCEFDYNSIKSGWNELSNAEGFNPTYTIDINYDDCYELSYNEFMIRRLGDMILTDLGSIESFAQKDNATALKELKKRSNPFDKGFLGNALNQVVGMGVNYLEDKLERAILGNLHTYSLVQIGSQVKSAMKGNVIATVQAAKDYVDAANQRKEMGNKHPPEGNIFPETVNTIDKPSGDLFPDPINNTDKPAGSITAQQIAALKMKQKPKGNIFDDITIVNNI